MQYSLFCPPKKLGFLMTGPPEPGSPGGPRNPFVLGFLFVGLRMQDVPGLPGTPGFPVEPVFPLIPRNPLNPFSP